ncbi:DUF554 domain-containing protein [Runella sp.]|uniref:DUF554 domain-containing protein n=1 Tax=Runella sp. TaxID=1960881 RepID=UPI003D1292F4
MIIGPVIDSVATFTGAILGATFSTKIPERLKTMLPLTFGAVSMAMGVVMIAKVNLLPPVVLSLLIGSTIGELLKIEQGIERIALNVNNQVSPLFPAKLSQKNDKNFLTGFVSVLVLFSASGTGIFGAMNEGITHNNSILISKAFLDFFTAIIFATSLGIMVATTVIPQFIILISLYFLGGVIMPYTTPELTADFSACGGVIMLATGLRITNIKVFPIANMLPALLIVMTISHYWRIIFL